MTRCSLRSRVLAIAGSSILTFAGALPAQAPCSNATAVNALIRAYVLSSVLLESRHFPPNQTIHDFVAQQRPLFVAGGASVVCARALSSRLLGAAIDSYDPNAYESAINSGAGEFAHDVATSVNRPSLELMEMGFDMLWLADVLPHMAAGDPTPYETTGPPTRLKGKQLLPIWDGLLDDPSNGPMVAQLRAQLESFITQAETNVRASVAHML
jgi:hypothetical protein